MAFQTTVSRFIIKALAFGLISSHAALASASERYPTQRTFVDATGNIQRITTPVVTRPIVEAKPQRMVRSKNAATHKRIITTSRSLNAAPAMRPGFVDKRSSERSEPFPRHCCRPGEAYWDYDGD